MGRSSWTGNSPMLAGVSCDKHWWMDVVSWTEARDTHDGWGWHRVQGEDGGWGGGTWDCFEQQNHSQHGSRGSRTRLSALLQEMTQIKYFNEKLIDNNWGNITVLLTEMKRLQKVAFDELLPKMAL